MYELYEARVALSLESGRSSELRQRNTFHFDSEMRSGVPSESRLHMMSYTNI